MIGACLLHDDLDNMVGDRCMFARGVLKSSRDWGTFARGELRSIGDRRMIARDELKDLVMCVFFPEVSCWEYVTGACLPEVNCSA